MATLIMMMCSGKACSQQTLVTTPQAITIAGGDCMMSVGSMSASAGEVAVSSSVARAITVVNVTESFSEGVQQPFTLRDRQQVRQVLPCNVSVYPNPTTDGVNLEGEAEKIHYTLFSSQGQRLCEGTFDGKVFLDLKDYPSGSYLLRVSSGNQKSTFRINLAK